MQRLDKILSDAGVATRKELRQIIRAGRVSVNGLVIRAPEQKFDESTCEVLLDGVPIRKNAPVLLMLHKPSGYVTATEDPKERTVMELIPEEYRRLDVKPIGRLDKDTEGLLLFTNQGELAHHILSPKHEVWKTYYARHEGTAGPEDVEAFRTGITLRGDEKCLPAELIPLGVGESRIRIREGKYHQVRRMMASRGMTVTYLRRESEGPIDLGDLPLGQTRELDPNVFS